MNEKQSKKIKIGILLPATIPGLEEIKHGFTKEITDHFGKIVEFKEYYAHDNKNLMKSSVEDACLQSFDLVFTIGALALRTTKEIFEKKDITTPIIFSGVSDTVADSIIENAQTFITGVKIGDVKYKKQVELLLSLKKDVKNILIPYNNTVEGLEEMANKIKDEFSKYTISVKTIPIQEVNQITERLSSFLPSTDVIYILRDSVLQNSIETLIKLCNLHGVTLYTSDLFSVKKGAAIGFGIFYEEIGEMSGKLANKILLRKKSDESFPLESAADAYSLWINSKTMDQQNLLIQKDLLAVLRYVKVIYS